MSKLSLVYKTDESAGDISANVHFHQDVGSAPKPIVLDFHAGGFAAGSTFLVPAAEIQALAALGFVVVVPEYRLCPQVSLLDGPLADARDLLAWARAELPSLLAKEGVTADGKKVAAMGHSAGGGMALWLASQPDPPTAIVDFYGNKYFSDPYWSSPLAAMAALPAPDAAFAARIWDGPVPLASQPMMKPDGKPNLDDPRAAWMISALRDGSWAGAVVRGPAKTAADEAMWKAIEPTKAFGKGFPPTLFVHGDADVYAPLRFAERAHEELRGLGVETELVVVEGKPHLFDLMLTQDDPVFKEKVLPALEFLKKHV